MRTAVEDVNTERMKQLTLMDRFTEDAKRNNINAKKYFVTSIFSRKKGKFIMTGIMK